LNQCIARIMCGAVLTRSVHSGNLEPMDDLSESELDQLWELMQGHAPGDRAEFAATLRTLVEASAATATVTPYRVEVKMPLMVAAFDRKPKV
jgi:hypothetical protein